MHCRDCTAGRNFRLNLRRGGKHADRFLRLAHSCQGDPQQAQSVAVAGFAEQHLAIGRRRFGQSSLPVQHDRLRELRSAARHTAGRVPRRTGLSPAAGAAGPAPCVAAGATPQPDFFTREDAVIYLLYRGAHIGVVT